MPLAKNGERPYPEAPKWTFWDPCLGHILPSLSPTQPYLWLLLSSSALFRYQ